MKSNDRARALRGDRDGVSSVIGAILVTGIVFSLLLTIRLSFVPVWEKDAESSHLLVVEKQLATIKSELDRQVDNRTASAQTNALTLVPERVSIFRGSGAAHRVAFNTSGHEASFNSSKLLLIVNNGRTISGLSPNWGAAPAPLTDVESVESLRVKFNLGNADAGEFIKMNVTDALGVNVGYLEITFEKQAPDVIVKVETYQLDPVPPSGNPIAASAESIFQQVSIPDFFVDALDPALIFDQLLAATATPFSITLSSLGDLEAEFAYAFVQSSGSGSSTVANSGIPKPNYNATYDAGSLVYTASSAYGTDQTYILENGALILSQDDGSVFRIPPSFSVSNVGTVVGLTMNVPSLSGQGNSISGATNVKVTTNAIVGADIQAMAPNFSMRVQTAFPQLWAQYWDEQFKAASLDTPAEYIVSQDATSASFTLLGTNTDIAAYDISIRLNQARIAVAIEG